MNNRNFLKLLMRGKQAKQSRKKEFFIYDGNITLLYNEPYEGEDNLVLIGVSTRQDIEKWEAFKVGGGVEACNTPSKNAKSVWQKFCKDIGVT